MIAVDTSALVAIAKTEPEKEPFSDFIALNDIVVGAPVLVEARIVLETFMGKAARGFLDELLTRPRVQCVPFTLAMYHVAGDAFSRYGKGRGHPAGLNYGDCLSYAVAKQLRIPLLFKGDDFIHTDITSAFP